MSLTQLTLELHIVIFAGILIFSILIGFLVGRKQIRNKERRILELENEMLAAHNEILNFAKTNKQLTETLEKAKIPFTVTRIEDEDEKVRKIPLEKIG